MQRFLGTIALCCATALPVSASQSTNSTEGVRLLSYENPSLPPAGYKGQWWTSPDKCQYSRAGRPGETVWYLIVNSAHSKCAGRLIQRAYSDYR